MSITPDGLGVLVIGGYLGAGKTTLVNHLLRHAEGRRIAVMVNDFGEVGIDADLILGQDGEVLQLAGGCICCSVGSDLVESLMDLAARRPRPDLVLIETSGVALPAQVARGAALAPGIVVDGVVVLADAKGVRLQMQDRHVGDTVTEQLRQADLLLLNKAEDVDASDLQTLQDWLTSVAPRARTLVCSEARVPAQVVLGLGATEPPDAVAEQSALPESAFPDASLLDSPHPIAGRLPVGRRAALARASRGQRPAASVFESVSLNLQGAVDLEGLAQALADPALCLVRVKGLLRDGVRDLKVLQMTGSRWRITAAPSPGQERLLMIGLKGQVEREAIQEIVERFSIDK